MFFQASNRAFQVNCVPKNDGSHHQDEAAGPITLVLEAAIAHSKRLKNTALSNISKPRLYSNQRARVAATRYSAASRA